MLRTLSAGATALAALLVAFPHAIASSLMGIAFGAALLIGAAVAGRHATRMTERDQVDGFAHWAAALETTLKWLLLALGAWGVVRIGIAVAQGQRLSWPGIGHWLALFVPFVVANALPKRLAARTPEIVLIGLGTVMLFFVLNHRMGPFPGRIFSPYAVYDTNSSISLSVFLAILAAGAMVEAVGAAVRSHARNAVLWLALSVAAMVTLFEVGMSRSAFAVFFVAAGIGALAVCVSWKQRIATALALVLLSAAAYAAVPMFQQRVTLAVRELQKALTDYKVDTSQGQRLAMTSVSLHAVAEHPLIGHGLGSWREEFHKRVPPQWQYAIGAHSSPHNEYLHFAVQLGWVGMALYAGVWLMVAALGVVSVRRRHSPWLLVLAVAMAIGSLTNVMLWDFRFWSPIAALLALALSESRLSAPTTT